MPNDFYASILNDQSYLNAIQTFYPSYRTSQNGFSEDHKNSVGAKVLEKIKASAKTFTISETQGELAISKADEYRALGMEKLANVVEYKTKKILREIGISAAGYKRINRTELQEFCKELEQVSDYNSKRYLKETPLKKYVGQNVGQLEGQKISEADLGLPPQDVLDKLKVARDSKLFDDYAVLHIEYVPDPILCGKIKESEDLYFIAEWGEDVKLSDIVK